MNIFNYFLLTDQNQSKCPHLPEPKLNMCDIIEMQLDAVVLIGPLPEGGKSAS